MRPFGRINSSSSIRVQFQPLEVRILSQNGFFHESSKRSKITLKRFWPNFFKWMLAKLIHDIPKFTVHISMNSNSESLSFKFSLKASFCQKQFAPKSYFNLDFLYKFPESNSAKRILQNSIPNFETENFELWVKFKIRHIFVLKCKIKNGKVFICQ